MNKSDRLGRGGADGDGAVDGAAAARGGSVARGADDESFMQFVQRRFAAPAIHNRAPA